MRLGLNAGFGSPLGLTALDEIQALGFTLVRQDVLTSDPAELSGLVVEFSGRPIMPLWIVGSDVERAGLSSDEIVHRAVAIEAASRRIGIPFAIEVMNEPDATKWSAWRFGNTVAGVAAVCLPSTTIVSGGITSTSKAALAYLQEAMTFIPRDVVIGFHSYRSGRPDEPLKGFSSRDQEFGLLKSIAAGRRLWNTEVGWNDLEKHGGLIPSLCGRPLTQDEVASNLRREIVLNATAGAEVLIVFQHRDGLGPQEHFGILDISGRQKKSALVAREV